MVSLMLLSTILVARWRIYLRWAAIGFPKPNITVGLVCVVLTAAAVPVLGLYSYPDLIEMIPFAGWFKKHSDDGYEIFVLSGGAVLFPVWIWLGIAVSRALLGSRENALARITLSRVMVYACAAAILINTAMVPLWHAVECHWVKKDTLFDIIPEAGMTRIEHDYRTVRQKEFMKIRTGL